MEITSALENHAHGLRTVDDLIGLALQGQRCELIEGELRMMSPAGGEHGWIAMNIGSMLRNHVAKFRLGRVYAAETGFQIHRQPDTVRAPDAAFVSNERTELIEDDKLYLPFAPDLAIEVLSPGDTFVEVEQKAFDWLDAGTKLVLVVNPRRHSIHAYRNRTSIIVCQESESFDATDVVPNWIFRVEEVFE